MNDLLFIGKKLGVLGAENEMEVAIVPKQLRELMTSTEKGLASAGLEGEPQIFMQWEEDV